MNRYHQPISQRDEYIVQFERSLRMWLHLTRQHLNADDVVQNEVLRVLERYEMVHVAHPDAGAYGYTRAATRHAAIDWLRRDSVQAGRGAANQRKVVDGEGFVPDIEPEVLKGERPEGPRREIAHSHTWFEDLSLANHHLEAADAAEAERRQEMLQAALACATPSERQLLEQVYLQGRSQKELAAELGLARETVNRQLHSAIKHVRKELGLTPGRFIGQ